jgi:threonine aldolase
VRQRVWAIDLEPYIAQVLKMIPRSNQLVSLAARGARAGTAFEFESWLFVLGDERDAMAARPLFTSSRKMAIRRLSVATRRIDLRSDTITQPTAAMRAAMAGAEVGDDVFGDDPTVPRLEARVAETFGKERALFVPTGTMANLIAVLAHTWERGSEYILGDRAHIFLYEQGGGAQFGGSHPRTVPTARDGTLALDDLRAAIREDDQHYPATKLICIENTHNMCGGVVLPPAFAASVGALASERGLRLHADGARIWNAMVASGEDGVAIGAHVDSLAVCLSKGLGAPAGSLVVGSAETITRARRLRKALGGAMRQTGILAAAGLHALDHHLARMSDDHARARALAVGLAAMPSLAVDVPSVHTNLLFFHVRPDSPLDAPALVGACAEKGVHFLQMEGPLCRIVTHLHVTDEDVDATLRVVREVLESGRGPSGRPSSGSGYAGGVGSGR